MVVSTLAPPPLSLPHFLHSFQSQPSMNCIDRVIYNVSSTTFYYCHYCHGYSCHIMF
jgi:hypothetical protein